MRILHLLASPVFSGPAENVALLALAQRSLGHDVTVAVDRKRAGLRDEEPSVPRLGALGLLDERGLELSVKSLPWAIATDAWRLRHADVDIVHAHFSHDHLLARFATPASARLIRSIHAPRSLQRLPRAHAYTVPSREYESSLPPGAPRRVLAALVSPEFQPARRPSAKRIGMVSHFQPSRRHELALHAFAKLKGTDHTLTLVGDGPTRPAIEALAGRLGVTVEFSGYQQGDAFVRALQSLDILWILGLGNDWTARTARQARACNVRVVSVNEGALSRWADATVEPDADALAEATKTVQRREVESLTNEDIARDLLRLYEEAR